MNGITLHSETRFLSYVISLQDQMTSERSTVLRSDNMSVKEYRLFKTAKKTAAVNKLEVAPNPPCKLKLLFDFELLDAANITQQDKDTIKQYALQHVTPAFNEQFYGEAYDSFEYCDGKAVYYRHRIYDIHGQYRYDIMQLACLKHCHAERKSIYDEYSRAGTVLQSIYDKPVDDLEV